MSNHFTVNTCSNLGKYWVLALVGFISAMFFMLVIDTTNVFGATNNTQTIMQQFYNGVYSTQMEGYITYIKYFGGY